ncbi:ABC transporter permease [Gordonia sp. HY002]|uniref:ABC transporter permease n=1 Tax=Gordonia zhenghanii TaxID=2911516 RepID=UPI001EF0AD1C|nr:ABC transporter permease [Gordonia zhenghanii]MCF8568929.1 ABC transporter permease [Gordonia zhenghanii]MCF8603024.1 ABC transporter permease [Gordonia zhenghanii]
MTTRTPIAPIDADSLREGPEIDPAANDSTEQRGAATSRRALVWPLRIVTVLAAVGLWHLLAASDVVLWLHFDVIPTPADVASAWWDRLQTSEYYLDLGQSLIRIGSGFVLAAAIGIPLGIALGRPTFAEGTLGALTELARPIPAIALVPIAILVFPSDEGGMVFITFIAALFPIVVSTRHAVRALPTIWEESVRTMGGTRRDVVWRVILPGITPGVFGGLSVGIGVSWICLISAEMISGRLGVGYRTWQSYTVVDYPGVFVGMFTIAALGAVTSGAIELIGRRMTRWLPRGDHR